MRYTSTVNDSENTKTRELFHVTLSFLTPMEVTTQVAAADKEHAKEIIEELFKKRESVDVIDVYPVKDISPNLPPIPQDDQIEFDFGEETEDFSDAPSLSGKTKLN